MDRPPSPALRFDPIPLDEYLSNPQMRVRCQPDTGQIYWIKPVFSDSGSNGYVGKNETSLLDRFQGHKTPKSGCRGIANALKSHGLSNFTIQRLQDHVPTADVPAAEKRWIAELDTWKHGYNCGPGGEISTMVDDEVRARHKVATKAGHNTPEYLDGARKRGKAQAERPGESEYRRDRATKQHKDTEKKSKHSAGVSKGWIKRKQNPPRSIGLREATLAKALAQPPFAYIEKQQRQPGMYYWRPDGKIGLCQTSKLIPPIKLQPPSALGGASAWNQTRQDKDWKHRRWGT